MAAQVIILYGQGMATILFQSDGIEEEFPAGTLLQDAIEDAGADIIFGCREGGCATCIIRVHEGGEFLSEPTMAEHSTLEEDELNEGLRLSCQVTISGEGRVVLESAGL